MIDGPKGIKETMKDDPETLANILKNGERMFDNVRGRECVWLPTFSQDKVDEHTRTEKQDRTITGDTMMR